MKNLIVMTQSRLAKGRSEAEQVQEEAGDDEGPEAGGREERSDFDEARRRLGTPASRRIKQSRKEDLQDREVSDREYLLPRLSSRQRWSARILRRPYAAVEAAGAARIRFATFRAVLQSLSSARTEHHPSRGLQSLR